MSARPLRVLIDGTPLLGNRTGVGRYTSALAEELASMPEVDSATQCGARTGRDHR